MDRDIKHGILRKKINFAFDMKELLMNSDFAFSKSVTILTYYNWLSILYHVIKQFLPGLM